MDKRAEINITKQDKHEQALAPEQIHLHDSQTWNGDIESICKELVVSSDTFNAQKTYESISQFITKHKRWLYSTISGFLFECSEKDLSTFISNLDGLREYAYKQIESFSGDDGAESEQRKTIAIAIDKLWDHSNLAQTQNRSLHDSDETFKARFDKNLIPFKSDFTHDMNMQFISLIAIFTALSFIVFGGISSLDNLFADVGKVPILELMIVGSIWSLCIINLVFVFIYFVAKLTKINIKSSNHEDASLSQRYPFFIWSNFIIVLVLAICCWLHYVDYSNAGGWLLSLSKSYDMCTSIGGIVLIGVAFGGLAGFLIKKPRQKKLAQTNATEK